MDEDWNGFFCSPDKGHFIPSFRYLNRFAKLMSYFTMPGGYYFLKRSKKKKNIHKVFNLDWTKRRPLTYMKLGASTHYTTS